MKIQPVCFSVGAGQNLKSSQNNTNFNGLLVRQRSSSDSYEYRGMPSSYNSHGDYKGDNSSEYYTYYLFRDESEAEIAEALDKNNYSKTDDCGGFISSYSCRTERGKTLEFTKREWNSLSSVVKRKIEAML